MRGLLIVALLMSSAAAQAAPQFHGITDHRPPRTERFVCKVLPRAGGGQCTTNPYAHLGAACECEGKTRPRPGVVSTR